MPENTYLSCRDHNPVSMDVLFFAYAHSSASPLPALQEEPVVPASDNEEFTAFTAARAFPGRMKCATLSWDEMEAFLEGLMEG